MRPGSGQQQPASTSSRRLGGQQDSELQELPGPPIHLSRRRKPKFIAGGGGSDVAIYPGRHTELPVEGREAADMLPCLSSAWGAGEGASLAKTGTRLDTGPRFPSSSKATTP